ncbi:very short patch repair endonuclease [Ferrimonas sp. SCSIO 43195]|uniref:very short patch repair endonuclease n=1 Tax=Ferrimonas sp. SCSIO 43195 TaxID=2822844 RepID=UPI002076513D|nr:DNA mismatch endonuclease Vsr [Ferrimonas sp. SCSIO 43195]USD38005.1 DNA mismatch endonuclease Vsr [Ferrimonas sp. SCSIO 43195]
MVDVHPKAIRSKNMRAIRSKNTKPEVYIRKLLHRIGFRFRIHPSNLPVKADIFLPRYNAVIWINGCFWHAHDCYLFKYPTTNPEFWREKLDTNKARDVEKAKLIAQLGFKQLTVWECSLKGKKRMSEVDLMERLEEWILAIDYNCEIDNKGIRRHDNYI